MFDCRMCGQCVLRKTGMACPTNCGKAMRNGPCGGVRADGGCEVDPDDALRLARRDRRRASDRRRTSGAIERAGADRQFAARAFLLAAGDRRRRRSLPIAPRPAAARATGSRIRSSLQVRALRDDSRNRAAGFGRSFGAAATRARNSPGWSDAVNITDGAGGNCHMSSAAAAAILATHGHTPVCQIACRDRNRIAVQGDILGAAALGVRNILCLTGDDVSQGDHPQAKPVFDLDAVSLLRIARGMRDAGEFASGRKLETPPDLFLGATANPFVPPYEDRIANLELKIDAGAQFIQTQFCFDLPLFERFMDAVRRRGLHERAHIIVGVGTLSSVKALRWMAHHVPGVHIPDSVLSRIANAENQKAEGLAVLVETIRALRAIEGVAGVHLMGHRNEATLAEAIVRSGVRARSERGTNNVWSGRKA